MRLLSGLFLFFTLTTFAQNDNTRLSVVDSVFASLDRKDFPGGVVGVMKGDQWLYRRAFGEANLEYDIPVTFDTKFNIASISKQFTAMAIVRLSQEGKLSVDDPLQKFFPEFNEFKEPVTLRQMLHHTSGLRSHHAIMEIAGWGGQDVRNNEDLLRIMERQVDLNFLPGSQYSYCNTGYILMAEIVERLTETNFEVWMDENIFQPLGMKDTYVEANASAVAPMNATSYYRSGDSFNNAVRYWDYTGSGNIHTTLEDLMKWYANYTSPAKGWREAFSMLQTQDPLTNGDPNVYAFGVEIDDYRGIKRIQHGGAVGGFRSFACAFPDEDVRIVVMTNYSSANPMYFCNVLADAFLEFPPQMEPEVLADIKVKSKELKKYTGWYWNEEKKFAREIREEDGKLWYVRESSKSEIRPVGKDLFQMAGKNPYLIKFEEKDDQYTLIIGYSEPGAGYFIPFEKTEPVEEDLKAFVGNYYSDELLTIYQIRLEAGKLIAEHARLGEIPLEPVKSDVLRGSWPLNTLEFEYDSYNAVSGVRVSNDRAKEVYFRKVDLEK